jgi:hypothetical protein
MQQHGSLPNGASYVEHEDESAFVKHSPMDASMHHVAAALQHSRNSTDEEVGFRVQPLTILVEAETRQHSASAVSSGSDNSDNHS